MIGYEDRDIIMVGILSATQNDNHRNTCTKARDFLLQKPLQMPLEIEKPFPDFEEDSTNFLILFPGKSTKINCSKGLKLK